MSFASGADKFVPGCCKYSGLWGDLAVEIDCTGWVLILGAEVEPLVAVSLSSETPIGLSVLSDRLFQISAGGCVFLSSLSGGGGRGAWIAFPAGWSLPVLLDRGKGFRAGTAPSLIGGGGGLSSPNIVPELGESLKSRGGNVYGDCCGLPSEPRADG